MKLPKQLPSVERKVDKDAAMAAGGKVHPSQWWLPLAERAGEEIVKRAPDVLGKIRSWF